MKRLVLLFAAAGCAAPAPRTIERSPSSPPLQAALLGHWELQPQDAPGDPAVDARNVVLCDGTLYVLYRAAGTNRILAVNATTGERTLDSALFVNPGTAGHLRVVKGKPVVLWASERESEPPAFTGIDFRRARALPSVEPSMDPREFGPWSVWTEVPAAARGSSPGSTRQVSVARFKDSGAPVRLDREPVPGRDWDAVELGDSLWTCHGDRTSEVELLRFDGTGIRERLRAPFRADHLRLLAGNGQVLVSGTTAGGEALVFDPRNEGRAVRAEATDAAAAMAGSRVVLCGASARGIFACAGTLDDPAWAATSIEDERASAHDVFVACGDGFALFGCVSGREIFVYRLTLP